jgi:sugar transferase EpsL
MRLVIKSTIDLFLSASVLIAASPLMAAIAVTIRLTMGRPILFRQVRPGYKGKPFELLKFRTMNKASGAQGGLLQDAQDAGRLTAIGRVLRRYSLDELPQLWNVLRGDMSLVGPRPLLMQYVNLYTPEQARRHEKKPGLTGWAQVNGRNALSWPEKFALDIWYVDHWSLWLDMRILFRTLLKCLSQRDIAHPGHATMPEFLGAQAHPMKRQE